MMIAKVLECVVPAMTLVVRGTAEFERLSKQHSVPDEVSTLVLCAEASWLRGTYSLPSIKETVTRKQWFHQIMDIPQ